MVRTILIVLELRGQAVFDGARIAGKVSIRKGGGLDVTLSPNTPYYIRARDYRTAQPTASTKLSANEVVYTRPATIADLTVNASNDPSTGITATVDIDSPVGTAVHWILTSSNVDHRAYKGKANIKDATVSATVLKKGTTDGTGSAATVSLHDGLHENATLSAEREYGFYYAVEGKASTLYADFDPPPGAQEVKEVLFTVPVAAPPAPDYMVDAGETTDETITVTTTGAVSASVVRRFFVSEGAKLDLRGDARDGVGLADEVVTFTITSGGTSVEIGGGAPAENVALKPNTKYYLYATDWNKTTGLVSAPDDISGDDGTWTNPAMPEGYEEANASAEAGASASEASVTFLDGGEIPMGLTRRYFASTSQITSFNEGHVKDGEGVAATRVVDDGERVTFTGLSRGTEYYFYFLDYNPVSMQGSDDLERVVTTPSAQPTLVGGSYAEGDATTDAVDLLGGPAIVSDTKRRFFYSEEPILDDGTVDMAGVPVETFVIEGPETSPHTFTLGEGTTGDALEANTEYYVRFQDTASGNEHAYSPLSADGFRCLDDP